MHRWKQPKKAFYELRFQSTYSDKKGLEFQNFFSTIMEMLYPGDFHRVAVSQGDQKCDGLLKSKQMLFQVYAPDKLETYRTIEKIKNDYYGAVRHWKDDFKTWVFVHNNRHGLPPKVLHVLLEIGKPDKIVQEWGYQPFYEEACKLRDDQWDRLFPGAPSESGMVDLELEDLMPVLDQIAASDLVDDAQIRPVPESKLDHNMLSKSVKQLLKTGMERADLVLKYSKLDPTRMDGIAAKFRQKYAELRERGTSADNIFVRLQEFAAGNQLNSPGRQCAVLAVLAHFFEECDIFENPQADGVSR